MLAKAIESYNAQNPSEMSFNINQMIEISSCDEYWCVSNGLNLPKNRLQIESSSYFNTFTIIISSVSGSTVIAFIAVLLLIRFIMKKNRNRIHQSFLRFAAQLQHLQQLHQYHYEERNNFNQNTILVNMPETNNHQETVTTESVEASTSTVPNAFSANCLNLLQYEDKNLIKQHLKEKHQNDKNLFNNLKKELEKSLSSTLAKKN